MTSTTYCDRSRIETYQRCARLRWLEYHQDGTGIQPARKSLALCVGGSVHKGLETLLRDGSAMWEHGDPAIRLPWGELSKVWTTTIEDDAVVAALADFATHRSALALDITEESALAAAIDPKDAGFSAQLVATAQELGMDPGDPALAELLGRQRNAAAEFDGWLWQEQAALVEGMVRASARRRLKPLLEEFQVLEVEQEGEWELASSTSDSWHEYCDTSLRFMSRPDALLRSRADGSLYILSFKTAATWDIRKSHDAEHDMQGLSEGVEIEKRLGDWWNLLHDGSCEGLTYEQACNEIGVEHGDIAPVVFLRDLPAPPRILGIRYEYLLKGARYADRDLSARFGLNVWAQRSHLIRAYSNDAGQWCWSYDFLKDDGGTSKLYYKTWRPRAVWESMSVKSWIDLLDTATEAMSAFDSTVGAEPRSLGWHSDAQALGYTTRHPLDEVFPPPMTVYRQDDQLRDWIDQVEAQEVRVAEGVAAVAAAEDDGDRRHALNVHFPMSRRACSYPSECAMTKVCFGGDDIRRSPLESGLYKRRVANHPQEVTK